MNLRSENPYWLLHTPVLYTYHALQQNIKTEIVVVGAGISGALVANRLIHEGHDVCIITNGHVGDASTCASTSLLQYEIDTFLYELIEKVGAKAATESYLLCYRSIDELGELHQRLMLQNIFKKRKSLLLASTKKDVEKLIKEFEARLSIGLQVEWLSQKELRTEFSLDAPAAIYSAKSAETDAYLLTQKLIKDCYGKGASVYDKTEIQNIKSSGRGVELKTSNGCSIKAKYAVMATGYESVKWIDKNFTRLHSTYAIISEPFKKHQLWKDNCLIWETARPYTYLRTTNDHRVIIGGKDEPFVNGVKRDALLNRKSGQLVKAFQKKFPKLPFTLDYAWAGTFAETRDGLPFIGSVQKMPHVFFALGFGGNGITFSQIAAEIIANTVSGKPNPHKQLFGFNRINYQ